MGGTILGTIKTETGILSTDNVCTSITPVCKVLLVVDLDPKEANDMLSLPDGLRFNFVAISWMIHNLWAPSSIMIFPSIMASGVLTIAMAVFNEQELLCRGVDLETDAVGVNSSVVVVVCLVPLSSPFV